MVNIFYYIMSKVTKLHYRLADSIRFNNVGTPSEAISREYYKVHPHEGLKQVDAPIYYETIYSVFTNSKYKFCPENSILFHFRLYDWLSWPYAGKVMIEDCKKFVDSHVDTIKKVSMVCILYGGCGNNDKDVVETEKFINQFIDYVKNYNDKIFILNSDNTDQDFKYMITAEYYVPSVGGFSTLAGAVNNGTVFWSLSDNYYSQYRSINEKTHIKKFKDHSLKKMNNEEIVYEQENTKQQRPASPSTPPPPTPTPPPTPVPPIPPSLSEKPIMTTFTINELKTLIKKELTDELIKEIASQLKHEILNEIKKKDK